MSSNKNNNLDKSNTPSLWDVTKSVLSAILGVQKRKNYERDFTYGKPWQYIIVGLIAVAIFIGILVTIVNVAINNAG